MFYIGNIMVRTAKSAPYLGNVGSTIAVDGKEPAQELCCVRWSQIFALSWLMSRSPQRYIDTDLLKDCLPLSAGVNNFGTGDASRVVCVVADLTDKTRILDAASTGGPEIRACAGFEPSCKTTLLSWQVRRSASIIGHWRCSAKRRCRLATTCAPKSWTVNRS